jgi:hypothetical protein
LPASISRINKINSNAEDPNYIQRYTQTEQQTTTPDIMLTLLFPLLTLLTAAHSAPALQNSHFKAPLVVNLLVHPGSVDEGTNGGWKDATLYTDIADGSVSALNATDAKLSITNSTQVQLGQLKFAGPSKVEREYFYLPKSDAGEVLKRVSILHPTLFDSEADV